MLRDAVAEGTPLGLRAKEVMARGDLVEDEVILGLIEESLEGIAGSGFVLDGFPRTLAQAKGLDDMLDRRSERLDCVILLTADTEVVVKRMVGRAEVDGRNRKDPGIRGTGGGHAKAPGELCPSRRDHP
jgi:adenylate kinase